MGCCGPFVPRVPTFNLPFKHYWDPTAHTPPYADAGDVEDLCQLVTRSADAASPSQNTLGPIVYFPAHTDIRSWYTLAFPATGFPVIEIPTGSNRWYDVAIVDDVHKGFPNEYRFAALVWNPLYGPWPIPDP